MHKNKFDPNQQRGENHGCNASHCSVCIYQDTILWGDSGNAH